MFIFLSSFYVFLLIIPNLFTRKGKYYWSIIKLKVHLVNHDFNWQSWLLWNRFLCTLAHMVCKMYKHTSRCGFIHFMLVFIMFGLCVTSHINSGRLKEQQNSCTNFYQCYKCGHYQSFKNRIITTAILILSSGLECNWDGYLLQLTKASSSGQMILWSIVY